MKRCPYCNKNIWDGAVECNYCGAQFGIQRKKQEEERKNEELKHKQQLTYLFIGIGLFVAIIAFCVIMSIFFD